MLTKWISLVLSVFSWLVGFVGENASLYGLTILIGQKSTSYIFLQNSFVQNSNTLKHWYWFDLIKYEHFKFNKKKYKHSK